MADSKKIKIKNAVLSFPTLFTPTSMEEGQIKKYSCVFMLPKEGNEKVYKAIMEVYNELATENKVKKELPNDNKFIVDGDTTDRDEYAGHWIIKAKNKNRPTVIDRGRTPIVEEDGLIYGGCIANGIVEPYYYKHTSSGKQFIIASLKGVQWVGKGVPFGDSPVTPDEFDDLGDDDDDDEL